MGNFMNVKMAMNEKCRDLEDEINDCKTYAGRRRLRNQSLGIRYALGSLNFHVDHDLKITDALQNTVDDLTESINTHRCESFVEGLIEGRRIVLDEYGRVTIKR